MAHLPDTDFVVIESGPLKGVNPETRWFATRALAKDWVDTRRGLFQDVDICRVLTRVSMELVPVETIEGDPL